ncbi:hypothetical protein T265_02497 [Opisthorchis viverrini]|uniref:Uncharacterized protein n=1 Tax=Opisthorchis viverrini TaxID=6198 RepID=A0A075A6E1_OPIVI|nr:hypothetical protein T265_02497 [Opisthorchis viverrini]KER31170.1 hypothetical protein T265_02497 [Opisthorchis viverrini]
MCGILLVNGRQGRELMLTADWRRDSVVLVQDPDSGSRYTSEYVGTAESYLSVARNPGFPVVESSTRE